MCLPTHRGWLARSGPPVPLAYVTTLWPQSQGLAEGHGVLARDVFHEVGVAVIPISSERKPRPRKAQYTEVGELVWPESQHWSGQLTSQPGSLVQIIS